VIASVLLAAAPATPVVLLLGCLSGRARNGITRMVWLGPIPALLAALFAVGAPALVLDQPLVRLTLALDPPGALLLGMAALLWIAAGAYLPAYIGTFGVRHGGRLTVFWLLTLTGSLSVFLAADMAGFFIAYCLVSLSAYGLVIHDLTPRAFRAGAVYVAFAILGESLVLMALVLLAASTSSQRLLITEAVAALPASPWHDTILALLITGFGAKIALVPLHVWMPLSYRAAPIPAAAAMSGAAVKAGVIGLIRFLPLAAALPGWGDLLVAVGLVGAFGGVAIGITQSNPKTVLAYSSISQMGFIAVVLGMALAAGDAGAVDPVAFYAACHVLVKGSLFLAIGVAAASGSARAWPVLLPAAVLGLGLAGLPLTGVGLAKFAVKSSLGAGWIGFLGNLSAAGTALLMLHFLHCLTAPDETPARGTAPAGLVVPWLAMALAGLSLPWMLLGVAGGTSGEIFAPGALWGALWPVLVGAFLALVLRRWPHRLPRVPEGDVLVACEGVGRSALRLGAALERVDGVLRQWPVAGLLLLWVAITLGLTMLGGR
jgi:formate hydrogenlyase subunit 3/multisubunit Na+/H+ antiporter MnhD subunit